MTEKILKLPQAYHWNRVQSFLAAGCAVAFAGVAGFAYIAGDAEKHDPAELCAPDNAACHRFVDEQNDKDRLFLSGLILVVGGGMALSRASSFYRRAEAIRQEHVGASLTL